MLLVANAPTAVRTSNGRRRTVPLFEALLLRLATGQTSRRTSPTAFLRLVIECAAVEPEPDQPAPTPNPALICARQQLDAAIMSNTNAAIDDAIVAYMAALPTAR
ncbi:hypothetical protein [Sphingomonas qomolangmaensis]|uniref:Uncharacterized protein n=1 Tax=Sphingomonas qomolangmaensis TaxID=2918765 RepID=A0ABY5LDH3_9SPHN|nr:hypothetical protein [Sphingomonas qomolangmaensis]UUL84083.1 hypothetical protein NMP03_07840 [Sphingomonas qomolangmaensis]